VRTYTISEAAELTGLTRKAIARRVERGSIRSLVRNGRRRIPHSELLRTGLLAGDEVEEPDELELEDFEPERLLPHVRSRREPGRVDPTSTLTALVRELVDRLERQATELATFRAISAHAENLRLENDLAELRARLSRLEGEPRRRELTQKAGEAPVGPPPGAGTPPRRGPGRRQEGIWLPPGAGSPRAAAPPAKTQAQLEHEAMLAAGRQAVHPSGMERRIFRRGTRLVLEVVFLVAVAAGVWFADFELPVILGVMAFAWIVVAAVEWMSWRQEH
jgi:excisionase family DNA binding protein